MHNAGIIPALLLHFIAMDAVQPYTRGIRTIGVAVVEGR